MRKILLLLLVSFTAVFSRAQNLSFSCPKDTVLGCGVNCFDLVTRIPDLRDQGDDYTIENISAFTNCYPVIPPGAPGPSTNLLIDDRYSSIIPLPFDFIFYGVKYNSVIASTNGYISFDVSNTGMMSHYQNFGNLPTAMYDRALIMGPYHDLDPSAGTSREQQIKYNVSGVAPNRKWILSYFRVPLYDCTTLIENTHQIILYETTGIIEVTVVDKEICKTSNAGHAMIGLQDYSRRKGIMAPLRTMRDPPWGKIGMNETWRFTPVGGASLYRKMELLDATGAVIANGDTTRIGRNTLGWTFPNVCPPSNSKTLYVVKTTFQKINDPGGINYSLDTVTVLKNALPVTALTSGTTCGQSLGSVTVTATGGVAPLSYSLNGGAPQAGNLFANLAAGSYSVTVADNAGCSNTITAVVPVISSLTGSAISTNASCPGVNDGTITVTPATGTAPFSYALNGGTAQASNLFSGLPPGSYTILFTDNGGCTGSISKIIRPGSNIGGSASTVSTTCSLVNNGSIRVTATGGVAPYIYALNGGPFQLSALFTGLAAGSYIISIQDSRGCSFNVSRTVNQGSGINSNAVVVNATCATFANGSISVTPLNGTAPYSFSINGATPQATGSFPNLLPGIYNILVTDRNGCTGMVTRTVSGAGISSTVSVVQTSCPSLNDGKITAVPTNGTAPYSFSLDGGPPQPVGTFSGLSAGPHSLTITDFNNCTGIKTITVNAGPSLRSSFTVANALCANVNDGSITIIPATGVAPYRFTLNPGGITQASGIFTGLAAGPYTYSFVDNAGCSGTGAFTITTNPPLMVPAVKKMPLCNGTATGTVTFNSFGGVAPYQYALSPFTVYQAGNTITGLAAGPHTFRIKDAVNCTKDTVIVLTEPSVLTASAVNSIPATCNGNDGTITISANGGTVGYQYSINNGSGYQNANVFIAPDTGFYPGIRVKDANGCIATSATKVTFTDTMRLSLGPDITICAESNIVLQPQTNAGTNIFVWSSPDAPLTTLSDARSKNPSASPADTARYILNATWGLCKRQDDLIVNVLRKPLAHAGKDTSICFNGIAVLRGTVSNASGPVSYSWTPAQHIGTPDALLTVVKPVGSGSFTYTLTVKDDYQCNFVITDVVAINVLPEVKAFAGNDTIAVKGMPHQLFGSGGLRYLWSPSFPLNDASLQNPLATLNRDTRFTLEVRNSIGCLDRDTVFIKVYEGPVYYVPNAFTPNGDGRNDIFRPIPVGIASTDYFSIFNRYGNLIFQTSQSLKGWDGTFRGAEQETGTYTWTIKGRTGDGRVIEQKGTVVLIR